jgi:hypothetical protein
MPQARHFRPIAIKSYFASICLLVSLHANLAAQQPAQQPTAQPNPALILQPAPTPQQLVQQVVTNELNVAEQDHSRWLYLDVDLTPKIHQTRWIAQTPAADMTRTLEENNQKLTEAQQRARMEAFLHDKSAQAKDCKKQQEDIKQTVELLKLLPVAFEWTVTGTQGDQTTLHFRPDPKFHPPNAQARILAAVEGDLAILTSQHRILNLKGQLIHDVKFGGGLLGEIKSGGTFALELKEVAPNEWQIVETHIHFNGHLLLFKSVSEQEDDIKMSYRRLPDSLTLEQAQAELLKCHDLQSSRIEPHPASVSPALALLAAAK